MNVNVVKKVCKIITTTAISTLTSCMVRDMYNKYLRNNVVMVGVKEKIDNLNPFSKN